MQIVMLTFGAVLGIRIATLGICISREEIRVREVFRTRRFAVRDVERMAEDRSLLTGVRSAMPRPPAVLVLRDGSAKPVSIFSGDGRCAAQVAAVNDILSARDS